MAKNFVDGISSPGLLKRDVVTPAPGKSTAGNRPQGGGGRVDCAIRRSCLTHRKVCRERRFRRDRGGATGTVAASLVFQTSDRSGSPKPRQRVRRRLAGARQQLPVGVGPDDRMPPGSREPKVSPPPEIRTTETT
uniref:Uncharacterized protein n=1 Tax=Escherichia coli TaxID=562 RepID=A0A6D1P2D8_ECOLX|nr:hypothetical protein PGJFMKIC_00036 [Escherichia coli]